MMPLAEECRVAAASCPHFADAAALLRVWARQQQLSQSADGLGGCVLTLLLVHLVQGGQAVSGPCLPAPAACLPVSAVPACLHACLLHGGLGRVENAQR